MDAWLLVQFAVIGLAVMASVAAVMHKQFPDATRRLRLAVALRLMRQGAASWSQSLGRWIAPAPRSGAANCAGCDNCD